VAGPDAAPSRAGAVLVTAGPRRPAAPDVVRGSSGTAASGTAPASVAAARESGTADPPLPSGLPSSAPLAIRLGAGCVVPGGTQRLVVETLPNAFVAFDNLYADDRDGRVHGGAEGRARSDAQGRYVATWRVAPDAPPGRVRIDVGAAADGRSAIVMRYYRLAARC
jgi:hypothetical protein